MAACFPPCGNGRPKPVAGASSAAKWIFWKLEHCAIREAREEVGLEISLRSLLCVTDHCLPGENQHWVSPAYLGQVLSGEATNCEPAKTREVRWFDLDQLPPNLTMTARNAIRAYAQRQKRL